MPKFFAISGGAPARGKRPTAAPTALAKVLAPHQGTFGNVRACGGGNAQGQGWGAAEGTAHPLLCVHKAIDRVIGAGDCVSSLKEKPEKTEEVSTFPLPTADARKPCFPNDFNVFQETVVFLGLNMAAP